MALAPFRGYLPFFAAIDAARYFLYVAAEHEDQLNHRQLQNLLYYGQGFSLRRPGKLLFDEAIEACEEGPVVAAVAREYSAHGDQALTLPGSFSPRADAMIAASLVAERVMIPVYMKFSRTNCTELTQQIMSERPFRRAMLSDGIVEPTDLLRWWHEHSERERARRPRPKPMKLSEYLAQHPELAARLKGLDPEADENSQT